MTEHEREPAGGPIEWIDGVVPYSTRYGDSYFSRVDGKAETGHVFIKGNDLPNRWPNMPRCMIGELGFGTGLNFLETLRQWRAARPAQSSLEFVSFEKHPLSVETMRLALSPWTDIATAAEPLFSAWATDHEMVQIEMGSDARLTVFFGDANIRLPQLELAADAWFLDGFAPSRNPDMWNDHLLRAVYERTHTGGTLATFSAAGSVRRGLVQAGFVVERCAGFAGKREMIRAHKP